MHLRTLGVMVLEFIFFGTLTLFGAVVTRSTIGAAIVGILSSTILPFSDLFLRGS